MKKQLLFFLILLISIFIGIGQVRADSGDSDSFSDSSSFSSSNDSDSDDDDTSDLGSGLSADADDLGHFSSDSDDDTSDNDDSSDLGSGLSADADDLGHFSSDSDDDTADDASSSDLGSGLSADADDLGHFSSDSDDDTSDDASSSDLGSGLSADADDLGHFSSDSDDDSSDDASSSDLGSGLTVNPDSLGDFASDIPTIDSLDASANDGDNLTNLGNVSPPVSTESTNPTTSTDEIMGGTPDAAVATAPAPLTDATNSDTTIDETTASSTPIDSANQTTDSIDSASSDKPNSMDSAVESNTADSAGNGLTANPDSLGSFVSDKPADTTGSESSVDLGSGLTVDSNETFNVLGNDAWGNYSPLEADYTVSATNTTNTGERRNPNMWGTETGKPFSTPTTALGIVGEEVYDVFDGTFGKLAGVTFTELGTYVTPDPQPVPEEVLTPIGSLNYNIAQGTSPVLGTGVIRTSETGARYIGIIADNLTHNVANNIYIGLTGETLSGTDAVPDSSPLPESVGRIAIIANNIVGSKTDVEPLDVVIGTTGYNPITGEKEDRIPSLFGIIQGMRGGQKEGSEGASNRQEK